MCHTAAQSVLMEVLHRSAEGLQHLCGHECDLDRFEWEKRPSVNTSGVLLLDLCANHTLNTVLKDKGVHICMRHQDFIIIPSDLQLYVLDTWVKSSSPPLLYSFISNSLRRSYQHLNVEPFCKTPTLSWYRTTPCY